MTKNIMEYKGYFGSVEYSDNDEVFFGKLLFINDVVSFEGDSVKSLKESFHLMVDDYIETCKEIGKLPQKPFKGSFNVRIKPELHCEASILATLEGKKLNSFVEEAIQEKIKKDKKTLMAA